MPVATRSALVGLSCGLVLAVTASSAWAANPTAEQALGLVPVQKGIQYDRPTGDGIAQCTIKAEKVDGLTGWVVRDGGGQIIRQFVDTNSDNVVDRWSYFLGGIEVYRDTDANHNGKADHYRWLNTAGSRWGIDTNEDGAIDSWKHISAEEVCDEAVQAMATGDAARFERLLLTADELKALGLGADHAKDLAAKVAAAAGQFKTLTAQQDVKTRLTSTGATAPRQVHFGASRPGIVPAGTNGSTKDVLVYENVVAMTDHGDTQAQVQVGTLIKVGDTWRLIDAPQLIGEGETEVAASGFFFRASSTNRPEATAGASPGGEADKLQQLLSQLEKIDQSISKATGKELAALHAQRADLLEGIAAVAGDDRELWIRQLADTAGAAAQAGEWPEGVARLKALYEKLAKNKEDANLAAYAKFRYHQADYGIKLGTPNMDFVTVQAEWLKNLQEFIRDYPDSDDAAEAMQQLAMAQEFAGQEDAAKAWYEQIVKKFPGSDAAAKAAGAIVRLESVGKVLNFGGKGVDGKQVDTAQYRGKVVLIHYWATWAQPCLADMAQIRDMQAKYGNALAVVGVNLDGSVEEVKTYLSRNRVPWAQIWEQGGLNGRPANALGIQTLPTMLLLDTQGKVVNRGIHVTELDREIGALVKK